MRNRPVSKLSILLETENGKRFDIPFRRDLDWTGWYLMHLQLQADQRKAFAGGGIFRGFRLTNCLPDTMESTWGPYYLSAGQPELAMLEGTSGRQAGQRRKAVGNAESVSKLHLKAELSSQPQTTVSAENPRTEAPRLQWLADPGDVPSPPRDPEPKAVSILPQHEVCCLFPGATQRPPECRRLRLSPMGAAGKSG